MDVVWARTTTPDRPQVQRTTTETPDVTLPRTRGNPGTGVVQGLGAWLPVRDDSLAFPPRVRDQPRHAHLRALFCRRPDRLLRTRPTVHGGPQPAAQLDQRAARRPTRGAALRGASVLGQ